MDLIGTFLGQRVVRVTLAPESYTSDPSGESDHGTSRKRDPTILSRTRVGLRVLIHVTESSTVTGILPSVVSPNNQTSYFETTSLDSVHLSPSTK